MRAWRRIAGAGLLAVLVGAAPEPGVVEGTLTAPSFPVAGAVVYLVRQGDTTLVAPETTLIDQENLRFVPRVIPVTPGTSVQFRNSDPIMHNVFSPPVSGDAFDLGTYPRPEQRAHVFARPGVYVILCHVHPEMAAFVVVVDTPYKSVVDGVGHYRIDGVPPGRYVLRVWHRRIPRFEQHVVVPESGLHRLDVDLGAAGHQ